MKNRRYYLLLLVCLAFALPSAPADAQSPATSVPPSEPGCKRLSESAAALPDSEESSKRLADCGKELSDQNDLAGSRRVFERADRDGEAPLGTTVAGVGALRLRRCVDCDRRRRPRRAAAGRERTASARRSATRTGWRRRQAPWAGCGTCSRATTRPASITCGASSSGTRSAISSASRSRSTTSATCTWRSATTSTALDYYQRSLDGLERLGDRRRSATVLDNMGVIARRLGDYGRGLELAQRAMAIRESFQDQVGIAKSFDSLSEVYQAQGNYGAALEALGKSLDLRRAIGRVHATAEALNNIAVVYEAQGSYEQAVKYLRESLALNDAKVGSNSLGRRNSYAPRRAVPAAGATGARHAIAEAQPGDQRGLGLQARGCQCPLRARTGVHRACASSARRRRPGTMPDISRRDRRSARPCGCADRNGGARPAPRPPAETAWIARTKPRSWPN